MGHGVSAAARAGRRTGASIGAFAAAFVVALPAVFLANYTSFFLGYFVIMPFSGLYIPPIPDWFFWLFASTLYPLLALVGLLAGLAAWGAHALVVRRSPGTRTGHLRPALFLLCSALLTPAALLALELAVGYEWVVLGSFGAQGLPVPDGSSASWFAWALRTLLPIGLDALVAALVATVALRVFSREHPG